MTARDNALLTPTTMTTTPKDCIMRNAEEIPNPKVTAAVAGPLSMAIPLNCLLPDFEVDRPRKWYLKPRMSPKTHPTTDLDLSSSSLMGFCPIVDEARDDDESAPFMTPNVVVATPKPNKRI